MGITEREIIVYREIYYETIKPMLRAKKTDQEIEFALKYQCDESEITVDRYNVLKTLDLMQRLSKINGFDKIMLKTGDQSINVKGMNNIPELKCPRRTEQK